MGVLNGMRCHLVNEVHVFDINSQKVVLDVLNVLCLNSRVFKDQSSCIGVDDWRVESKEQDFGDIALDPPVITHQFRERQEAYSLA